MNLGLIEIASIENQWIEQALGNQTPRSQGNFNLTEDDDTAPAEGESWTNPFSEEFDRRKEELLAMPGFQLKADLEALGRAGRVNYKNQQELVRHAGLFSQQRSPLQHDDGRVRRRASALLAQLPDFGHVADGSQRVVMRHRWGNQSEFETGTYTTQRKATFATGEAEFMSEAAQLLHASVNPGARHGHNLDRRTWHGRRDSSMS